MRNIGLLIAILIFFIGFDQITKEIATEHLKSTETLSYFYDTFRWVYAENHGAFLGLGDNMSEDTRFWVFVIAVSVMILGMLGYVLKTPTLSKNMIIAIGLIASGGISNLIDRIVNNGAVIDFMNMGIGSIRTGIFNVADMVILLGIGIIIFINKEEDKTEI